MKHASIYITESIAKRSETQAFRRYTEFKQNQGETDINKIKEDFIEFRNALRTDIISLRTVNRDVKPVIDGGKYEEGCTRLFLNKELTNAENIRILDNIITVILKNSELYNQYDKNLNELSLEELKGQFQETLEQISADEREKVNNMNYGNQSSSYDIIPINSFEDAEKYYPYCIHKSFSNSENQAEWCLTYSEEHFKHYTNNGLNQIYFCVQKGVKKDDEPIQGDGHPQDEYGNSMISVIVDENGNLVYATSRWNHELGANDKAYSAVDISKIVGVDFYKTFKPNRVFQDSVDKAINIYRENSSLEGFNEYRKSGIDGLVVVTLSKKQNIFNTKTYKIISNIWFNYVDVFKEGLIKIELVNKGRNFMNADGEILSDIWFESSTPFNEGFSDISIKDKGYNYINTNGEFLSDIWFDFAFSFFNGIGKVYKEDKGYNFIKSNGDFLSKIWFKDMHPFIDGVSVVSIDSKGYNYINTNGEFLSDIWFDVISDFINGIGKVYKKDKGYNFINTNGEFLSNIWIDRIYDFKNNNALIYLNNKGWNFINTNGKIISDIWFSYADNFKDGIARVKLNDKGWNFINSNGEILSDIWFDNVNFFKDGIARVKLDDKGWNFINTNGEIISDIWFEDTRTFFSDFAIVYLKNRKNELFKIDRYGNLYDYYNNNLIHKGILAEENGEQIAYESLRRKYAKELNEVLDLNKRIKKLYE